MAVNTQNALASVMTFGISLGVLGNLAVIISICGTRKLIRSNYYYLLLHLAFCDLCNLIFYTEIVYNIFNGGTPIISHSYILCKTWSPIHTVFLTAGANFLIVISMVRYRAIVHPFKLSMRRRTLKILSTLVYVFAIICIIPFVLVLKFDATLGCTEDWPLNSLNIAYTVFLACVQYFIPAVTLSIIYFKICKKLITQNRKKQFMNAHNQLGQRNEKAPTWYQSLTLRNKKTFLVSFVIVSSFIVSAGAVQVVFIVYAIKSKGLPSYEMWLQGFYIFGNLVLNPCVYGALDNKVFSLFTHFRKKRGNKAAYV